MSKEKMGCSGSVTLLDGASERQSLLLRSPRVPLFGSGSEAGSQKRESDLRRRRMSLWLKEKETEIVTHVLEPPPHTPEFRCVRIVVV